VRPALHIEPHDGAHDRSRFDCADDAINAYLRTGLDRDVGRYGCVAYMATLASHRALVAARSTTGSSLLVVDAKNDALITFYARLGFTSLPDEPRRLVYPMHKIEQLFAQRE
jgi:hypothetical protein